MLLTVTFPPGRTNIPAVIFFPTVSQMGLRLHLPRPRLRHLQLLLLRDQDEVGGEDGGAGPPREPHAFVLEQRELRDRTQNLVHQPGLKPFC